MVILQGDIHGDVWSVINTLKTCMKSQKDNKDLVLILLGDVGVNFKLNQEDYMKKEILQNYINDVYENNGINIFILCVRGNHDCRPANIYTYKNKSAFGGEVYVEDYFPNLIFLKDGERYNIENKNFLVIGGGNSADFFMRLLNEYPWWSDETLSYEEQQDILEKLENETMDNITMLSHVLPAQFVPDYKRGAIAGPCMEEYLDTIYNKYSVHISQWFCGHYHRDISFKANHTSFSVLYKKQKEL